MRASLVASKTAAKFTSAKNCTAGFRVTKVEVTVSAGKSRRGDAGTAEQKDGRAMN